MKNVSQILVASLVATLALTACGKGSKGSGGGTPPVATSAAGTAGFVGVNTYKGNLLVVDRAKYIIFLTENGLCFGAQCNTTSNFFTLQVQTLTEMLPDAVNFILTPRQGGYTMRSLRTQGDGYMNAGGNGFQVEFVRQAFGYGSGYGYGNRPVTLPYGPGQVNNVASKRLLIVLSFADATNLITNVEVQYDGAVIGRGQMRGLVPTGLGLNGLGGPVATPYR